MQVSHTRLFSKLFLRSSLEMRNCFKFFFPSSAAAAAADGSRERSTSSIRSRRLIQVNQASL